MALPVRLTISKDVETREELDSFIRTQFTDEAKSLIVLQADAATLQNLNLSKDSLVHGVRVEEAVTVEEAPI